MVSKKEGRYAEILDGNRYRIATSHAKTYLEELVRRANAYDQLMIDARRWRHVAQFSMIGTCNGETMTERVDADLESKR